MKKRGRKKQIERKEFPLLRLIEEKNKEAEEFLAFYNYLKEFKEKRQREKALQEVLFYVPGGTILEDIVRITYDYTDIYPSIAFFASLVLLGAKFTQMGFEVKLNTQIIKPNLWILTLASSGVGKSFVLDHICLATIDRNTIEEVPSTSTVAGYFEIMSKYPEKRLGIIIRDEIAQLFKMMRKDTYIDLKDFFLRAYNGTPMERNTKKDGLIRLEGLYLSVYGNTVLETFAKNLNEEDLIDGFLQRFMIHIPNKEERDKIVSLYLIPSEALQKVKQKYYQLIEKLQTIENKTFRLSEQAIKLYDEWFRENFNEKIESYYRRYFFSAIKIALIIKLLNFDDSNTIGLSEMAMSLRIITKTLDSFLFLLDEYLSFNEYAILIKKVEKYINENPSCKKRDIVLNVRGIKNTAMLDSILQILSYENEKAKELLEGNKHIRRENEKLGKIERNT